MPENVAVTYYLDVNFLKCAYGVNDLAYCNQPNCGLHFSAYVKQIQLNVAFVYIDQDDIDLDCSVMMIVFVSDHFEYTIPYNMIKKTNTVCILTSYR